MSKLRLANSSDFKRILALEHQCFGEDEMVSEKGLKWRMEHFPEHTIVIEEDHQVVAYLAYVLADQFCVDDCYFKDDVIDYTDAQYCIIIGLATDMQYRKRGYSRELINELLNTVNKPMVLTCHDYLIDFYRSFGFQLVGVAESNFNQATWYNMTCKTDLKPIR